MRREVPGTNNQDGAAGSGPPPRGTSVESGADVVTTALAYRLGTTRIVSPAADIAEVVPCRPLTRIPGAADWVAGALEVRGTIVPIVDLQHHLWGPATRFSGANRILVPAWVDLVVGLLVDEVIGIKRFERPTGAAARPATGQDSSVGLPAVKIADERWYVLDLARLGRSDVLRSVARS